MPDILLRLLQERDAVSQRPDTAREDLPTLQGRHGRRDRQLVLGHEDPPRTPADDAGASKVDFSRHERDRQHRKGHANQVDADTLQDHEGALLTTTAVVLLLELGTTEIGDLWCRPE